MTLAHLLGVVASGWVTVSLANSLFFGLSQDASRTQVLRYLGISLIPVSALAPLVGPLLDRFHRSHRRIGASANLVRAACCVGLAASLGNNAFFVFAFCLLIANKVFNASKYSIVPQLVNDSSQLVGVNCRLARMSTAAGVLGAMTGAALNAVGGASLALVGAVVVFVLASVAMKRVPTTSTPHVAPRPASKPHLAPRPAPKPQASPRPASTHYANPRARSAAVPYVSARAAVGFFAFSFAFSLPSAGGPSYVIAAVAGAYGAGSFLGNVTSPVARRRMTEERMIELVAVPAVTLCALAVIVPNIVLVVAAGFALGLAASMIRQAFDSILQTSSQALNRGRSYARFETQAQLGWAAGAVLATWAGLGLQAAVAVPAVLLGLSLAAPRRGRARLSLIQARQLRPRLAGRRPAWCAVRRVGGVGEVLDDARSNPRLSRIEPESIAAFPHRRRRFKRPVPTAI